MGSSKRTKRTRNDEGSEPNERGAHRAAKAFREGGRETRGQLEGAPRALGARARKGVAALLAVLGELFGAILRLVRAGLRALEEPTAGLRRRAGAAVAAASRALTPARGLLVAAIGCAVLLALSQFADYRGVEIGGENYDATISAVAPAPEVEREELGSAHAYAMIPAALLAIIALLLAARAGRWQLCRVAALIGVIAIGVTVLIDRPAGLDEGQLTRDFAGVEAKLLGGYWAQLFAAIGLVVTSLMLGRELQRSGGGRPRREGGGEGAGRRGRPDRPTRKPRASDVRPSSRTGGHPTAGAGPDAEGAGA